MAKFKDGSEMQIIVITVSGFERIWYAGASSKTLETTWNRMHDMDAKYAERKSRGFTDIDGWDYLGIYQNSTHIHEPVIRMEIRHIQSDQSYQVVKTYTCKSLPANGDYVRKPVRFK